MLIPKNKSFFLYRKCHMTILEVMIATLFLSMLLTIIFGFFHELSVLNIESKKVLKDSFQKRFAETRLSYAFTNLTNENSNSKRFYFYTVRDDASKSPSLLFTFDNGTVRNPLFAGFVLGRLFVDKNNRLSLGLFPLQNSQTQTPDLLKANLSVEYLLDHVEQIRYEFVTSPETDQTITQKNPDKKTPPKGIVLTQWEKDYKQMPILLRIYLTRDDDYYKEMKKERPTEKKEEMYTFVLPSSKNPITFIKK